MKIVRRSLRVLLILFLLLNAVAAFHAYRFTHFYENTAGKITKPEDLTWFAKLELIVFGMKYPKSKNNKVPELSYEVMVFRTKDNLKLEGWYCKRDSARGTVILFHGHGSSKSSVIGEAQYFHSLGFNTLSMDFRAHGGSEGNLCTIGYDEAEDVKLAFDAINARHEENIILWGRSLGAATITRAVSVYGIKPAKIILEMCFGSLEAAVKSRVRHTGLPEQPFAALRTFWGGVEQGFWAFDHNPCEYAKRLSCPVMLQHAAKDNRVDLSETKCIYDNIKNPRKKMVIYDNAVHESLYRRDSVKWESSVREFVLN